MASLFDDADEPELKINPVFAKKYEDRKKREELSNLKDKYGDSESEESESTSEEEDETGQLVTPFLDAQIVKTIASIKRKDPEVYDPKTAFFEEEEVKKAKEAWKEKQKKKEKPVTLKDLQRKRLLEGKLDGEDYEEEGKKLLTMVEEQEKAKRELKAALEAIQDDESDALFTVQKKSADDAAAEEEDYKNFLLENIGRSSKAKDGAYAIADWTSRKGETEEIDKDEKFLWDYILNRGWVDKSEKVPSYEEIVESSDEENVEKAEEFEREYNFRFEEDGGAGITGFSRNVESVRRKDDRRKKERESKAARKAEEKARKEEELKRLRNLKKSEILGKLEKIRELSGAKGLPFSEVDLEGDFDPENYDKLMEKAFDEDYYVDDDPEGKPEFREEIDIGPIPVDADEDYYGYAAGEERPEEPEAEEGGAEGKKKRKKKKKKDGQQEEAFIMDADFLDEAEAAPDAKAARLPKKKVQAAVDKYLEDTYQLDFEDVVAGIPTRFKYAQVKPESYGLDPVDILLADDAELNELISLKKLAPYRAAEKARKDAERWKKTGKKKMAEFKKKVEARKRALETGVKEKREWKGEKGEKRKRENDGGRDGAEAGDGNKDKKKKKKNKDGKPADVVEEAEEDGFGAAGGDAGDLFAQLAADPGFKIKKPKKKKNEVEVSEARLQSYLGSSKKHR